ncbi:MAG: hypothetical protein ABEJ03_05515, partial [Candidatus Nanohaloarchaea archaeon]
GPIHIHGEDYLPVYKELMELCDEYFEEVIGTYPDFWDTDESPQEFYDRTIDTITDCDLFIAEVTSPSHGVGMELQMAVNNDIPVLALAQEGEDISSMVEGLPTLHKVLRYSNREDLVDKLEEELQNWEESNG